MAWARRPDILHNRHRIFLGDARELKGLATDESVHLVVTSPSYWNLKKYVGDVNGSQLGHVDDRAAFLCEVEKVWRLCFHHLVPGGGFNAVIKNDIEFILIFRKPGEYRHPSQEQRDLSLISKENHKEWFQHPAPFPVEIARRLIGMFSFVGDTVLDPFWGIGNTTHAAIQMHRSSIGFEIEPSYVKIGRDRIGCCHLNRSWNSTGNLI